MFIRLAEDRVAHVLKLVWQGLEVEDEVDDF